MLNNHLRFTILYHRDVDTDLARIVGFEVEPFSVKHSYEGTWDGTGVLGMMCQPLAYAQSTTQRCRQPGRSFWYSCLGDESFW